MKSLLTGWTIPPMTPEEHIRKYSTTGDILAYKECRRQYGFFKVRGFRSASTTQLYFGILVHDVLDRIFRDYGLNPNVPNAGQVRAFVDEAHDRLIRSGIRPLDPDRQKKRAANLITRFILLAGAKFLPHVKQTEYRLERSLKTHLGTPYVLQGVVDVLSGAVSHELGLPFSTEPDDIEIWDYKASRMPAKGSKSLRDYEYQMRVYAELYRQQTGDFPARSVLVFLDELDDEARWRAAAMDPALFPGLFYWVTPNPKHVTTAMLDFHGTVEAIEDELQKPYEQQWLPPCDAPEEQTCVICGLQYNCSAYPAGAKELAKPL